MADLDRLNLYLQWDVKDTYVNTAEEHDLVSRFTALYSMAKSARDSNIFANPANIGRWRKSYYGILNALNADGTESDRKSKQLRKLVYEMVESKIDNNIPLPKMKPKYKSDIPLVEATEDMLKYEIDNIFTKYINDKSERATYVDGTCWYKVGWDSLSKGLKVDLCLADQIIPQPGISDYRDLEYIFELSQVNISTIYDLYGRLISAQGSDQSSTIDASQADLSTITMVTCYYLNSDRIVGKFAWAYHSHQVICDERDWQIRKFRTCTKCGTKEAKLLKCPVCGSTSFKYEVSKTDILETDLVELYNPYDVGETDDLAEKNRFDTKVFLTAGTEIPFYTMTRLPFIPRPAVSSIESLYGISEVFILNDMQDSINKVLTKAEEKTLMSGAVITKPHNVRLDNTDETIRIVDVKTQEQAAMIQSKDLRADTSQDIMLAQLSYDSAKASSGITDSFQGKRDTTATSGKAKEFAASQTAGRIESLRVMKAAAFAGIYELALMNLLAFSDEPLKFVKTLPDGQVTEQVWNKYMFLNKDKYGTISYRDDFSFSSDPAATLSQNRIAMWQETTDKFVQGALGNPAEPATLELYWNMMEQQQYPLAKTVLAGIRNNAVKLPEDVQKFLMENPQVLQLAMQEAEAQGLLDNQGSGSGGARPNSGPKGNGATHATNVERTNERNRAGNRQLTTPVKGSESGGTIS